jgi:H+-transporting ATPase
VINLLLPRKQVVNLIWDGFAGVFPEHKYRVVEILQGRGHLIACSGDGVNDAPALKKADVGIAVEGASEVARAAASMVLLAPGLGVIIDAIHTSRQIFNRMYGYSEYRIAISLQLVIYLVLSQLIFNEIIPVTLVVFLALFSDIAVIGIAYDRAETSPLPMQWNLPKLVFRACVIAICLLGGNFIIHTMAVNSDMFGDHTSTSWQAVVFLEISLTQNWMIFSTRTHASAFYKFYPNPLLALTVFCIDILSSCFAGFGWFTSRISIEAIVYVWLLSFGVFILTDVLIRGLAKWQWLDDVLTGNYKSAEKEKKMREWEEMMHHFELMSSAHEKHHDKKSQE